MYICLISDSKSVHLFVHIFTFAYTLKIGKSLIIFLKTSRPFIVTVYETFVSSSDTRCVSQASRVVSHFDAKLTSLFLNVFRHLALHNISAYLVYVGKFKRLLELCILMLNTELKPLAKLLDSLQQYCFCRKRSANSLFHRRIKCVRKHSLNHFFSFMFCRHLNGQRRTLAS